jgi:hypothetical protein
VKLHGNARLSPFQRELLCRRVDEDVPRPFAGLGVVVRALGRPHPNPALPRSRPLHLRTLRTGSRDRRNEMPKSAIPTAKRSKPVRRWSNRSPAVTQVGTSRGEPLVGSNFRMRGVPVSQAVSGPARTQATSVGTTRHFLDVPHGEGDVRGNAGRVDGLPHESAWGLCRSPLEPSSCRVIWIRCRILPVRLAIPGNSKEKESLTSLSRLMKYQLWSLKGRANEKSGDHGRGRDVTHFCASEGCRRRFGTGRAEGPAPRGVIRPHNSTTRDDVRLVLHDNR